MHISSRVGEKVSNNSRLPIQVLKLQLSCINKFDNIRIINFIEVQNGCACVPLVDMSDLCQGLRLHLHWWDQQPTYNGTRRSSNLESNIAHILYTTYYICTCSKSSLKSGSPPHMQTKFPQKEEPGLRL